MTATTWNKPEEREWVAMPKPPDCQTDWHLFHELQRFAMAHGPPMAFEGWGKKLVEHYLQFHLRQRTLVWCLEPRGGVRDFEMAKEARILGMGIVWPESREWIERCTRERRAVWNYALADWEADSLYVAEWIVRPDLARRTEHPTRRQTVQLMARTFYCRWPGQRGKPIYAHHRGRLVQMSGRWQAWAGLPQGNVENERTGKELVQHG